MADPAVAPDKKAASDPISLPLTVILVVPNELIPLTLLLELSTNALDGAAVPAAMFNK